MKKSRKRWVSKRRNEEIADMFHEIHFVEKWGRGISLILSKEPDADFEVVAGIFITRFKRKHYVPPTRETTWKILELLKENPKYSRKEVLTLLENMVGSKLVETVGSKLVENQLKIVLLILEDEKITKNRMSEILNISNTAVDKNILKLKKIGIIKRIGPDKGGHWEVKE